MCGFLGIEKGFDSYSQSLVSTHCNATDVIISEYCLIHPWGSAREFDVMRFLLQSRNRNLSKEVILAHVWGYDSSAVENHVEVYVGFLRKKLMRIGSNIRIVSIRRLGYHLEVDESC